MKVVSFQQRITRQLPYWLGFLLFVGIVLTTENLAQIQRHSLEISRNIESRNDLLLVREQVERSLSDVIHRSAGIAAYIESKSGNLNEAELLDFLRALHANSDHVLHFELAQDTIVRYVYPSVGLGNRLTTDYRALVGQWPDVLAAMNSSAGILSGPLQLPKSDVAPGKQVLIYRMPVRIHNDYWGLLSTVIDAQLYLDQIASIALGQEGTLAIRAITGHHETMVLGQGSTFRIAQNQKLDIKVPGGQWQVGFAPANTQENPYAALWRILSWLMAVVLGFGLTVILVQRRALQELALVDVLTGIANRRQFDLVLKRFCQKYQRRNSGCFALLYVDLDRFKAINDEYGHKAGDYFLAQLAERASHAIRGGDLFARWGGDEFAVILDNPTQASIDHVVDRIRSLCEMPVMWGDVKMQVGASVGVVQYPNDGLTADELVSAADQQMYQDKNARRQM